jgi:histidyl-tRNA synthetase
MNSQALPGFRDFYPEDTAARNRIFAAWREVSARYGFVEYDGPPLEPLELYTQKSGEEIVQQLYSFEDKGGRQVALRPEMTPTLARMVGARIAALKKPVRWFSMPQLFRYERQQRGRLREHFQLNMDLIGEPGPLADAEVIGAAIDIMRALDLGPEDVRVRLSDRRLMQQVLAGMGVGDEQLGAAYAAIDKLGRDPRDALRDRLVESGFEQTTADDVLTLGETRGLENIRALLGREAEAVEPLSACIAALDAMGLGAFLDVDLSIVRGLAYYTGTVFELFDAKGSLRAICGGGRYDGLLAAVGGTDHPAVGFGMGDVVLGELLSERETGTPSPVLDAFLVAVGGEDRPVVMQLAHEMRDAGLRVEFALREQSVAKQMKLAASRPARCAVVVGPDERAQGEAVVRALADGTETRVPFDLLVPRLSEG